VNVAPATTRASVGPLALGAPPAPAPARGLRLAAARRALSSAQEEGELTLWPTRGVVPEELCGVLYRNGPGRMECGGHPYRHPFDGDGMVSRFSLEGGALRYRSRFVRTLEFEAEERAGRPVYRSFGTNLPGGLARNVMRLRFKNAANTNVVLHAGVLLALWEGGAPHALDPVTLRTLGRHDFHGRLRNLDRFTASASPLLPFAAHPKRDPLNGDLVSFGTLMGVRPKLLVYRVDGSGRLSIERSLVLPRLPFVHDFALTPRFFVFHLGSVSFELADAFLGRCPPAEALHDGGLEGTLLLLPRDGGAPRTYATPPGFCFHLAGAFEDGDRVAVDAMRAERLPDLAGSYEAFPPAHLTRWEVDLARDRLHERRLTDAAAELPVVAEGASAHRWVWSIGGTPSDAPAFSAVLKHDTLSGAVIARDFGDDFPSEPVLAPRPGARAEDDGWLLVVVYRSAAHRSDLVVLDARSLAHVATFALPRHTPLLFHGAWVQGSARA